MFTRQTIQSNYGVYLSTLSLPNIKHLQYIRRMYIVQGFLWGGGGLKHYFMLIKKRFVWLNRGGAGLAEKEGLMGEDFLKTYSFVKTWGLTNREV